jgi:hypothetical protein
MLVVVGGHSRNIGKTSVAAGLIRHLRNRKWTALKITQYGHGVCSHHGEACGCETEPDHPYALSEEYEPSGTDSGRFLAAGAERSFWLRTPAGQLSGAARLVRKILTQHENVIVESNSLLELATPDLFLMVLDFGCADFKASSARFLERADALVVVGEANFCGAGCQPAADWQSACPRSEPCLAGPTPCLRLAAMWDNVPGDVLQRKTRFGVNPPSYMSDSLVEYVAARADSLETLPRGLRFANHL